MVTDTFRLHTVATISMKWHVTLGSMNLQFISVLTINTTNMTCHSEVVRHVLSKSNLLTHLKNQFFPKMRFHFQPWGITPNHSFQKRQTILGVFNHNTIVENDFPTKFSQSKSRQNVVWRVSYHDRNLENPWFMDSLGVQCLNFQNYITLTNKCNRCPIRCSECSSTRLDVVMSKL